MDLLKNQLTSEQLGRLALHPPDEIPCTDGRSTIPRPLPCENNYRLLFAENPSPMWILDEESLGFLEVNHAASLLYGYTREEFLGMRLPDLFPAGQPDQAGTMLEVIKRHELPAKSAGTWRQRTKSGLPVDIQITSTEMLLERKPAALVVIHDVSELKRVESELHETRTQLEQRVRERTAEIEKSNANLVREMSNRQRLEQKILEVSESEQRKLGQDLHDDLGQQLTGMALLASVLATDLKNQSNPLAGEAQDLVRYLGEASLSARNLARGLYPITLDRGGFLVALDELATRISKMSGVNCSFKCEDGFKLKDAVAIQFYRIIQEGVNNAIKHGKAKNILIECKIVRNLPWVMVKNDGEPYREPKRSAKGMGLSLMRHRARTVGAHLIIRKGAEGGCEMICSLLRERPERSRKSKRP